MKPPPTPQAPPTVRMFTQRFSSTPLGARLARHLALHRLHDWGIPYGSQATCRSRLVAHSCWPCARREPG
jgi:hypothetical protein